MITPYLPKDSAESPDSQAGEALSVIGKAKLIGNIALGGAIGMAGGGIGLSLLYALRAKTGIDVVPAPALIGVPAALGAMNAAHKSNQPTESHT